jgi:HD-GYP domain-containing protein (c-di-GMP phosphodiesterase class II)
MEEYLPIRRTQAFLLHKVALYIKNSKDDFILFKGEGQEMPDSLLAKEALPGFYILRSCQAAALIESQNRLNRELYRKIRGNGLIHIKQILCELVDEALRSEAPFRLGGLPETVEILFKGFAKKVDLLAKLAELSTKHHTLKEHSVNVMVFALNHCFFSAIPEGEAKRIALSALLHDIGFTRLTGNVFTADHFLSDEEFHTFRTHPSRGYEILKAEDPHLAAAALEHHERLDGSGYPMGIKHISLDGRLIGLIDSFDHLSFREKSYRKARKPFEAMSVIQAEVLQEGKFDREIFKCFCLSLGNA